MIVALSIVTLTAVAQNTKSINFRKAQDNTLLASIENSRFISTVSNELEEQLEKLAELTKFYPQADIPFTAFTYSTEETFSSIAEELEKTIKFRPEESMVSPAAEMMVFEAISNELEESAKYTPSESMMDPANENANVLNEALVELEKDARYHPAVLQ